MPESIYPQNVLGSHAAKPFYIWANEDCSNVVDCFTKAKEVRLALINDGAESVYITDADGAEVVDSEIHAQEALMHQS